MYIKHACCSHRSLVKPLHDHKDGHIWKYIGIRHVYTQTNALRRHSSKNNADVDVPAFLQNSSVSRTYAAQVALYFIQQIRAVVSLHM